MAITACFMAILMFSCQENIKTPPPSGNTVIHPVPLPTNIVPGFKFPEDTATIINGWLGGYTAQYFDTVSIYKHAWGIWAGLTAKSGEKWNGQDLLVYETWAGITDIQEMVQQGKTDCPSRQGSVKLARARQFDHARSIFVGPQKNVQNNGGVIDTITGVKAGGSDFWVTVAYNPSAACHATKYQLLDTSTDPSSGHFIVSGVAQPAGSIITIDAFELPYTYFVAGTAGDNLQVRAFDGFSWSAPDADRKSVV